MNFDKENFGEQFTTKESSHELVPYESSMTLAKDLWARYQEEMRKNRVKDVDGWADGLIFEDYQDSIVYYLEQIPPEILEKYVGHGITRKGSLDQLAAALSILANKAIKGECAPLASSRTYKAFTRKTSFLVISKFNQPLVKMNDGNSDRQEPVFNEIGWEADIGTFVVNVQFYPLIDELKRMYPDVKIIKANEIVKELSVES